VKIKPSRALLTPINRHGCMGRIIKRLKCSRINATKAEQ
jgi:hypothetical protein